MSQENVELVYRFIDAFNRRDVESFLAFCDAEVEYSSRIMDLEGGSYRGHDGMRTWWASLLAISPDFRVDIEEVRDLGDVTLTRLRAHGHGAGSDVPMEQTQWEIGEWRHGKVIWSRVVLSEAEALEAAGLRE